MLDVTTEVTIARPVDEVAAYAGDPTNVSAWYANIRTVTWDLARLKVVLEGR